MSERQVINLLRAELADGAVGLAAAVAEVLALEAVPANVVTTEYTFSPWIRSNQLAPAAAGHEISIVPSNSSEGLEIPAETQRDGTIDLILQFVTFHSDPLAIEENLFVHAAALRRCLDRLREYSDANAGTVLQVLEPVRVEYLPSAGSATSASFRARFTIEERSQV